ncbi:MAG: alpha/beta fold hydrolase [Rhodothermaceae bacterium]
MTDLFIKTYGNKNNQAIVFLHGFPFDHQLWEEQVKELKENYFCISFDIRGLGKSEVGDGQYTLEKYSDDLIQLVKSHKLNKPVLCGMSMGGYILLRSVEKEHDLFGGIVLINTKSEADNDFVKLKRGEGIEKINSEGLKKFNKEFITPLFSQKTIKSNTKLIDKIIRRANKSNPVGVKAALLAMASRTDTTESLTKISLPTLVLCGKQDKLTPPEVMEEMAGKIVGSEFFTIPAAAHMAPVENSNFVNKKIKSFVKKIG